MSDETYFKLTYSFLILIFLFCGLLRCCNLWHFPRKQLDELYPARREVACAYFAVLFLLPCAIHPHSPDALTLARCFWILYIPAVTGLAYYRFFGGANVPRKRLHLAVVGGIPATLLLGLSMTAGAGGDRLSRLRLSGNGLLSLADGLACGLGLFLAVYMLRATQWVAHEAIRSWRTRHTHDDGFPRRFAFSLLGLPPIVLSGAWCAFFLRDAAWQTAMAAVIAVEGMGILVAILHPQRASKPDTANAGLQIDMTQGMTTPATQPIARPALSAYLKTGQADAGKVVPPDNAPGNKDRRNMLSETQLDTLERQIREIVEGEELFLNPNLKRETLEEELGINRSYLSETFALRFGSLNRYLNLLRMEYAQRYAASHPEAKQAEIAHHSGFGSMNTYYRAKSLYESGKLNIDLVPSETENGVLPDNKGTIN